MASKPVLLLGNLASIALTIAGILQALSWTIAGAMILAILSIATLAPSKGTRSPGHGAGKKILQEPKPREKTSEKQPIRPHQTPSRPEQRSVPKNETLKPSTSLTRPDMQKAMAPKITSLKTIPTNFSPSSPGTPTIKTPGQDPLKPIPIQNRPSPAGGFRAPMPRPDPNVRVLGRGDYATYDLQLDQGSIVTCEVTANATVNAYILNQENLTCLDLGEEFWSESGEEGVDKATLTFVAPQTGKWFLVVENTDNKEASARVNIRKDAQKTGSS